MPRYDITIPDDVYFILNKLEACGHGAHIVGGCVRDMLIGKAPTDYDITTSATPDEVKNVFSEYRTVDTGIKHGTVTLILGGAPYEITTYRTEGAYTDNRHPDSVSFTRTLAEDLSRRDFTVNAMCADKSGKLTDLFGGESHVEKRIISAVGTAEARFSEDALRILRALRFSATLGFALDGETAAAVRKCKDLLTNISVERSFSELLKLLSGDFAYDVLGEYGEAVGVILPELRELSLPPRDSFARASARVRLASLFALGADAPHIAFDAAMKRLHTDTKTRCTGALALERMGMPISTASDALRLLYSVGDECADFTAELRALVFGDASVRELLSAARESGLPYKISDMALGGGDFVSVGFSGENIGRAMEGALFAIMDGEIANDADRIRAYIKELKI